MFLAGIAVAALGLTGLPARAGGPWLRRAAALVTLAGVALAGIAVGLASTARVSAHGVVIPALHDAANDAPIAYTPVCGRAAGVPVCLNPAYRRWLPDVTAALAPVLAEVAGLPGAPARATQVAAAYPSGDGGPPAADVAWRPPAGAPPVARPAQHAGTVRLLRGAGGHDIVRRPDAAAVRPRLRGRGQRPRQPGAAGRAGSAAARGRDSVRRAARADGTHRELPGVRPGPATGPVYAAARRLAALPAAARHAWLAAHLAALRAGRLTLQDLP